MADFCATTLTKFKLLYLISSLINVFSGDVLSRMQRLEEWYRTGNGCNIASLPEFKACMYYKIGINLFRQVLKTILIVFMFENMKKLMMKEV